MGGVNLSLPLSILAMLLLLFEIAYRRLDFNININFLNKSDRDILQEISEKMDKLIVDYLQESKIE